MAETTSVDHSDKLTQAGHEDNATWRETSTLAPTEPISILKSIGLIYDLSSLWSTDSEGRRLDPLGFEIESLALTLATDADAALSGEVFIELLTAPDDFSTSALPSTRSAASDALSLGTFDIAGTEVTGDTVTMTFSDTTNMAKLRALWGRSDWGGVFSVIIVITDDGVGALVPTFTITPTLTLSQWDFHTGHNKAPAGSRAVHCQRSGRAVGTGQLQVDGYLPGVWVTHDHWDTPDIRRTPPDVSSTERERQDEVPE
jgi:hypothetical protein